jgi:hypothetical protein
MKMSSAGQSETTREAVLIAQARDYLTRSATAVLTWAEQLQLQIHLLASIKAKEHHVPDLVGLTTNPQISCQEYARVADAWRRRVERWLNGCIELPVWLEEPWVAALADPWRTRCREELQRRHGYLPAPIPAAAGTVDDCRVIGLILTEVGELLDRLSPLLENNRFDSDDRPHGAMALATIHRLEGQLVGLRSRIRMAVYGESLTVVEKTVTAE